MLRFTRTAGKYYNVLREMKAVYSSLAVEDPLCDEAEMQGDLQAGSASRILSGLAKALVSDMETGVNRLWRLALQRRTGAALRPFRDARPLLPRPRTSAMRGQL